MVAPLQHEDAQMTTTAPEFRVMIVTGSPVIRDAYTTALTALVPASLRFKPVWERCTKRALVTIVQEGIDHEENPDRPMCNLIIATDHLDFITIQEVIECVDLDADRLALCRSTVTDTFKRTIREHVERRLAATS